jgi:recombination protein RecA
MAGLKFLEKFKKDVAKLDSVGVGIRSTEIWLSTGNYALNRALSGNFFHGIPLSKITLFAGPSGSGKSFIAGNVCLEAQKDGYHVLYIDSEHAIDVDYLQKIGVKTGDEDLTYVSVTTIEDVNRILSEFFSGYIKEHGKDNFDAPRTLIVLDSLAMLSSSTEMENYDRDGTIKADQGILAKRRKAMLRLAVGHLGRLPIAMVVTDHVYPQDIMMGDGQWAITNSTKFSSSIIGIVTKLKLKVDGAVAGVRMRFETYKSRFAKLGTKVELEVPYNKGMSSTSGLIELLEEMKVIGKGTQPGEKLSYVCEFDGQRYVFKEKDFTDDIARKVLKHPDCAPMLSRVEPEIDLNELADATDTSEE